MRMVLFHQLCSKLANTIHFRRVEEYDPQQRREQLAIELGVLHRLELILGHGWMAAEVQYRYHDD